MSNYLSFVQSLTEKIPLFVKRVISNDKYLTIEIDLKFLIPFFLFMKKHTFCQYKILIDITNVDYPDQTNRFIIVYHLISYIFNQRLAVKVQTNEEISVPSLTSVFNSANWLEREVWDLFGIFFSNHPDLRRILTDYGFQGYPLRKDFPLTGFLEVSYIDEYKKVVYNSLELSQEYRFFDFSNSWQ